MASDFKIFSGRSNPELAREICNILNLPLGDMEVMTFPDGEIFIQINENVRGMDTFVIQPTAPFVNERLLELLIIIDTLKRASARRVTAIIPYYGYARQDRKDQPRVPITAKLVANLITVAGADRVLTVDLHAGQIQGFFDIPLDNLFATQILVDYFRGLKLPNLVVVSPDIGSVKRARAFASKMDAPLAIVDKRRPCEGVSFPRRREAEVMNIIGDVAGKNIIIFDDLVDTAGTLTEAVIALKQDGALEIYAGCTHGVLSGEAIPRIMNSPMKELVITNTIAVDKNKQQCPKIRVLSIANLLAQAIGNIYHNASVSALFT
ncbi:MAG: ribose-phosphate pyrophosphokinase [bacterium]|nr:ribose-phosphate pyrophosphokinase [bacterium]